MKRTEKVIHKIEKVVTFISDDGIEFTSEEACKSWEESYRGALSIAFNKIPHIVTNGEDAYLPNGQFDEVAWILRPRCIDDIKTINEYGFIFTGEFPGLTQDDIGKVFIIDMGRDTERDPDWLYIYDINEYLNNIKKTYDNFIEELNSK